VRKYFESTNRGINSEAASNAGSSTDREDLDLAVLEDEFIMGKAYGDSEANEGKTRDEIRRAEVHNAIFVEAQEEVFHNAVPDPELKKDFRLYRYPIRC
jgi:hypothetical protein